MFLSRGYRRCVFCVGTHQSELPQANFVYVQRKIFRSVLSEELSTPEFKEKLSKIDATIVARCGNPVTEAKVECIMDNIPFGNEAVSTTRPKYPEHIIPDQDYVTIP